MLILTRMVGETIVIATSDGPITLKVRQAKNRRSSIGIEAPKEVKIMRGELLTQERECVE